MSYRDYEREERDRLRREEEFQAELQKVKVMLDEGKLAVILTELRLFKQKKNY